MKKLSKILVIALVVATLAGVCVAFAACDNNDNNGQLIVATNCEFEPFEYLDDNGNPTGIDIDIAYALGEKLGLEVVIRDMAFDSVVASASSGVCDIAMAGLTVTGERLEAVNFTQTYFSSSQVVIAPAGDPILDITYEQGANDDETEANRLAAVAQIEEMLNGKRVGTQNGTTGYAYVSGDSDDYEGVAGATAVGYASGALAVEAMLAGTVDYVIIDAVPASRLVAANSGTAVSDVVLTGEDYAYGIAKNNTELLEKVNQALNELIADGTIEEIFQKYGLSSGLGE
ncbi:MAG: ABC transporter substrate-binding protein [Christensenellales bacterium]|nr:ABC transporter substrate-binding protein [Christensenellales bacterium]